MTSEELKDARSRLGFTQEQLAEALGVSRNTVARWERDEIGIPPYLDLALPKIHGEPIQRFLHRVMNEQGITSQEVSLRATKAGFRLSTGYIHNMLVGNAINPTVSIAKALAAGLGRPEDEVFRALGVNLRERSRGTTELDAVAINYGRLDPKQQREVDPLINVLSREIQRLLKR